MAENARRKGSASDFIRKHPTLSPTEVVAAGVPAKVRGPVAGTGAQMWVDSNPGAYQDLARRYVDGLREITEPGTP